MIPFWVKPTCMRKRTLGNPRTYMHGGFSTSMLAEGNHWESGIPRPSFVYITILIWLHSYVCSFKPLCSGYISICHVIILCSSEPHVWSIISSPDTESRKKGPQMNIFHFSTFHSCSHLQKPIPFWLVIVKQSHVFTGRAFCASWPFPGAEASLLGLCARCPWHRSSGGARRAMTLGISETPSLEKVRRLATTVRNDLFVIHITTCDNHVVLRITAGCQDELDPFLCKLQSFFSRFGEIMTTQHCWPRTSDPSDPSERP